MIASTFPAGMASSSSKDFNGIGLGRAEIQALIGVPIVLGVWGFLRRVRKSLEGDG